LLASAMLADWKRYPPGSVITAPARPSHGDDGFPLGGPLPDIPDRRRGLGQRERSVDHRGDLTGFEELLQDNQVRSPWLGKNERSRWPTNGDVTSRCEWADDGDGSSHQAAAGA